MTYTITVSDTPKGKQRKAGYYLINMFLDAKKHYQNNKTYYYHEYRGKALVKPYQKIDNTITYVVTRESKRSYYLHQIYDINTIKIKITTFHETVNIHVHKDICGSELYYRAMNKYAEISQKTLSEQEFFSSKLINHRTIIGYDTQEPVFDASNITLKAYRTFRIFIPSN
jgi:hypothetical protein